MSTALRQLLEITGDLTVYPNFMTHSPEGCFYSAIALIYNSFLHLSDYGTKSRNECLETMGTSHELSKISCAVSPFLLYTVCMVF